MSEQLRYDSIPNAGLTKEANVRYWDELREFFSGQPGFIPPMGLGAASIAVNENDELVAAGVMQLVTYLGPIRIREDYRNKVDFMAMKKLMDGTFSQGKRGSLLIQGYIAMTADERVAKLAEFVGMKRIHPIVLIQNFLDKDQIPL
jgi:hypothetical protein